MTIEEQKKLACEIGSLSVFRNVLKTKPMTALLAYLSCDEPVKKRELYGEFVYLLAEDDYSFSDFLCRTVLTDENRYVTAAAKKTDIPPVLAGNAAAELALLSGLTTLTAESLCGGDGYVPQFASTPVDFGTVYAERIRDIDRYGYGVFATAGMFRVEGEKIVPVTSADAISLDDFIGYEAERRRVFDNIKALADGKTAANTLLFGDAGTGKSSTVKALANHFYTQGVRLIELRKDQIFSLPLVMGKIAGNPLKFIIFIDDLSFNKNDDSFSMLKAALEGSASAKAENAIICATSNRRHIVKETFSDRNADDVHRGDTMQELLSLSDRFGLTVYFEKPDKRLYLEIVHALAEKNGISPDNELDIKAEAFALGKGSRSPRAAGQFIRNFVLERQAK